MSDVTIFMAFLAGVLSFVSPCCLPLYPAFLSFITGSTVSELKEENKMLQKRSMLHTFFFLVGFSVIFIAIGFGTSLIGDIFISYQDLIRQIGAIFIVFFGLVIVGVLQFDFLNQEKKLQLKNRPEGYAGSFLIGLAFSAGWTPCMGPILVAVIGLASTNPSLGMVYMIAYILGFAIPFFVMSFFVGKLQWIKKYSRKITKIGGWLLIVMGILLFFDWMSKLTSYLVYLFGGFTGF